jgi:hypothetical protein
MNVMSVKRKFTIDEVINLTENCYYVTVDDVIDLCNLREIGFENVRWVKDLFEEFGGCWVAEKCENEIDRNKHGGMVVCLSVRVGRILDDFCERENRDENVRTKNKVEILMYDLHDSLDKWNGNNMRNVNRIILVLEDLVTIFKMIRNKQIER